MVMNSKLSDRLNNIYKALSRQKLDALLVTKQVNAAYLSGMSSQIEAYLIVSPSGNYYITDFRYLEETKEHLDPCFNIIELNAPLSKILNSLTGKYKLKKLGFESRGLNYNLYSRFKQKARNFKLYQTDNLVEDIRQIKDTCEQDLIRQCTKIAGKAWKEFVKHIRSDSVFTQITEKHAADKLEYLLRKHGATKGAFDIISACGPNISRPHAVAGQTRFEHNQPVLFDFGAVYKSYHCDITRNFIKYRSVSKTRKKETGCSPDKYRKIYRIVQQAQRKAIQAIKPGVRICDIDHISRSYITDKGFGENFGHSLGHGVGLEVHEAPAIADKNTKQLKPGMVFTVEPGIYIPGWGGVRIEDMVLVTEKGCEVLTDGIDESV